VVARRRTPQVFLLFLPVVSISHERTARENEFFEHEFAKG
jgi:hypothetical protein